MFNINLNHNYRDHLLLGAGIGFWLVFFLIFIAPFDILELPFSRKIYVSPLYGFFFLGSYLLAFLLQEKIYQKWKIWNLWLEVILISFTLIVNLFFSYFYYTMPNNNGEFSLSLFLRLVYKPISMLITSLLIFGRVFINRQAPIIREQKIIATGKITLLGENKNDVLHIEPQQIICISSAQNYVEIFYRQKDEIAKHLIRNSLKKVSNELDFLLQVHRSHLINPAYIIKWIDNKTLLVDEKEIPVSKTYKTKVIQHLISVPKTAHLVPKEA